MSKTPKTVSMPVWLWSAILSKAWRYEYLRHRGHNVNGDQGWLIHMFDVKGGYIQADPQKQWDALDASVEKAKQESGFSEMFVKQHNGEHKKVLVGDHLVWSNEPMGSEEPDLLESAVKTLVNLGYTWEGAALWKPPVGDPPTKKDPLFFKLPHKAELLHLAMQAINPNADIMEFSPGINQCTSCGAQGPAHSLLDHKPGCEWVQKGDAIHKLQALWYEVKKLDEEKMQAEAAKWVSMGSEVADPGLEAWGTPKKDKHKHLPKHLPKEDLTWVLLGNSFITASGAEICVFMTDMGELHIEFGAGALISHKLPASVPTASAQYRIDSQGRIQLRWKKEISNPYFPNPYYVTHTVKWQGHPTVAEQALVHISNGWDGESSSYVSPSGEEYVKDANGMPKKTGKIVHKLSDKAVHWVPAGMGPLAAKVAMDEEGILHVEGVEEDTDEDWLHKKADFDDDNMPF